MSTYDSSAMKSGNTLDVNQLITEANKLGVQTQQANTGSLFSSASGTLVTILSKTITLAIDDIALIHINYEYSISDGNSSTARFGLYVGGVNVSNDLVASSGISNSAGNVAMSSFTNQYYDASGSITFNFQFSRNTGSGTVYCGLAYMWISVTKRKA